MVFHLFTCNINFCSMDVIIKQGSPSRAQNLSGLSKCIERFEEKVNASSKDEVSNIRLCVCYYGFLLVKHFILSVHFSIQRHCLLHNPRIPFQMDNFFLMSFRWHCFGLKTFEITFVLFFHFYIICSTSEPGFILFSYDKVIRLLKTSKFVAYSCFYWIRCNFFFILSY